jgi:hypothetical protein
MPVSVTPSTSGPRLPDLAVRHGSAEHRDATGAPGDDLVDAARHAWCRSRPRRQHDQLEPEGPIKVAVDGPACEVVAPVGRGLRLVPAGCTAGIDCRGAGRVQIGATPPVDGAVSSAAASRSRISPLTGATICCAVWTSWSATSRCALEATRTDGGVKSPLPGLGYAFSVAAAPGRRRPRRRQVTVNGLGGLLAYTLGGVPGRCSSATHGGPGDRSGTVTLGSHAVGSGGNLVLSVSATRRRSAAAAGFGRRRSWSLHCRDRRGGLDAGTDVDTVSDRHPTALSSGQAPRCTRGLAIRRPRTCEPFRLPNRRSVHRQRHPCACTVDTSAAGQDRDERRRRRQLRVDRRHDGAARWLLGPRRWRCGAPRATNASAACNADVTIAARRRLAAGDRGPEGVVCDAPRPRHALDRAPLSADTICPSLQAGSGARYCFDRLESTNTTA